MGRNEWPNFDEQVALGLVPGFRSYRKFGMNGAVNGSGTTEDMWQVGTPRVLPSSAAVASLTSDSAEDDPDEATPPGTGAHTVMVEGLDANYYEVSEEVTLSGTGAATSTQTFLRLDRMYITKVGTNGTNVGNITATVGGATQAFMEAGEGQTHQCMYTVPADHYLLINYYNVGVGRMANGDADIHGEINLYNDARGELEGWRAISALYLFNGQEHINDKSETLIPPKTELRVQIASTAATQAHAIFGGYLINKDHFDNRMS